MAISNKVVDLTAANKLNISITSITPAQSWKRQVRGVYALIYLYAQEDFLHIKDFDEWTKKIYSKHKHKGNKGRPTSKPLESSKFSDKFAKALLIAAKPLGKVRKGITNIISQLSDINTVNTQ